MSKNHIGNYEIGAEIGRGGMATVYSASDKQTERQVAVKILLSEYLNDLGFRARFEREARMIASLEHAYIVPVLEFGQDEDQLYIVMEYMPNGSLAGRLALGSITISETVKIVERLSMALDYAHENDVIHRDIKPSNILFDKKDNAYLADFGIAFQTKTAPFDSHITSGTPTYMSPEQARGKYKLDGRSDLYALGINVFEMLTGRPPFSGDSPMSIMLKQMNDPPPSPNSLNPQLPPNLETVMSTILAKDPDERYQTGTEFVEAFLNSVNNDWSSATIVDKASNLVFEGDQSPNSTTVAYPLPDTLPSLTSVSVSGEYESGRTANTTEEKEHGLSNALDWLAKRPLAAFISVSLLAILGAAVTVGLIRSPGFVSSLRTIPGVISVPTFPDSKSREPAESTPLIDPTSNAAITSTLQLPNIMMVYTDTAVTILNISSAEVSLTDLMFRRMPAKGSLETEAFFSSRIWSRAAGQPVDTLQTGECLQLLRDDEASPDFMPEPIMLTECNSLIGALVANNEDWHFWLPEGGVNEFQVLQKDQIIFNCQILESLCEFHLPQP
jgi:serine/threonine protein kinase